MRTLTAKQKSIVKRWVLDKYKKTKVMFTSYSFPSDPAEEMIKDGTYEILEKINDTEILYQEINRFADDFFEELRNKER